MFCRMMVAGAQTCCALLHFVCDMKAAWINVQCLLIQELTLYEFELGHNTAETIKYICCVKVEGTLDHSTVTR